MNYGHGLGSGRGLEVTERDLEGATTFEMDPELFNDSYLPCLLVGSRDVEDQEEDGFRMISFLNERRGLVSLWIRKV